MLAAAVLAAAAATLRLVPTARARPPSSSNERAKQGILKCFEKRDDKLVNVCKLAEIEERKADEGASADGVAAEVPSTWTPCEWRERGGGEAGHTIKLRETPEWLSGSKSGEAGVAARERLPGPFGGGKRKKTPKKEIRQELRAAAEEARREAAAVRVTRRRSKSDG